MKGRKTIPTPLKVVKGTARVDRINPAAPAPAKAELTRPEHLPEDAHPHFLTLQARLRAIGLDSSSYSEVVTMAAMRMAEIDYCNSVILEHGSQSYETHTVQGGRMIRSFPEVAMRSEAMRHLHGLLSELGLTPAAIGKVGAKLDDKPKTGWEQFAK